MKKFIKKYPIFCVVALVFICLVPAMTTRDFTPSNELRYLNIANEAIANHKVFAFTNNGIPYADKPPLYIWLVMLCKILAGEHSMFLLSLLSFIPSALIVWIMDSWLVRGSKENGKEADPLMRIAMALMLFTTGMFFGACIFVRMDTLMALFIVLAIYSFYKMYKGIGNVKLQSWLFPLWIFLGLFTKGPVGLLMPIVSVICFLIVKKQGKEIGKYLGLKTFGVIIGLCAIWLFGVWLDGGSDYLYNLTIHQTFGRAFNSFSHKKPFYFYFVAMFINLLPYFIFMLPILVSGLLKSKEGEQKSDTEKLFLSTICATFVMMSLFSAKLPIYLLPIVPFLVYCLPLEIERRGMKSWMRWCLFATAALFAIISGFGIYVIKHIDSIPFISKAIEPFPFATNNLNLYGLMILLAASILSIAEMVNGKRDSKSIIYLSCGILFCVYSASFEMKALNPYIGYGEICKEVPSDVRVTTLFVRRAENMKVYLGRDVVDYHKDIDKFMSEEVSKQNKETEQTVLIINSKDIQKNQKLSEFVHQKGHLVTVVGPNSLVLF